MADKTVSFLPWLRLGVSNEINSVDKVVDGTAATGTGGLSAPRVNVDVELTLSRVKTDNTTDTVTTTPAKNINIIGPGDILMLNPQEIKSVKPVSGEKEFDYNHLAFVEFNAPDLPWRFTPSKPTIPIGSPSLPALRPWLSLVVLKSDEFSRLAFNGICSPIKLTNEGKAYGVFTPHDQIWAWGHVQVNDDITLNNSSLQDKIDALKDLMAVNPSVAFSRIICPRRLEENTYYSAFLIPTFEVGRKTGLKQSVGSSDDGLQAAWEYDTSTPPVLTEDEFPVYYEWGFRTSADASFETMARRIKAVQVENYEAEKLCLSHAHPALEGKMPVKIDPDTDLPSILKPLDSQAPKAWDMSNSQFVDELLTLINTPDTQTATQPTYNGDPIVTPPIYGKWHAKETSVSVPSTEANWLQELNLDPRYRVMAGLGAEVVRKHQEHLMDIAWADIDRVLKANRRLAALQVAQQVQDQQYKARFYPNDAAHKSLTVLAVGDHVHKNILSSSGYTVHYDLKNSTLPEGIFDGRLRSLMASGGTLAKSFSPSNPIAGIASWLDSLSNGAAAFAENYSTPTGMSALSVLSSIQMAETYVNNISPKSDFVLTKPGYSPSTFTVGTDNDQANYFRDEVSEANKYNFEYINGLPAPPTLNPPDISALGSDIHAGINPWDCILEKAAKMLVMVDSSSGTYTKTTIDRILAAPRIDVPLSEPLYKMAPDMIIPNLADILKNNTSTVFEANYKALEAYMVGANVEMAKELLWRGYPTDQRGTCFKKFWRSIKDGYVDIDNIHSWKDGNDLSVLGQNNPDASSAEPSYLILAIRGDLLSKFPRPLVYMKQAELDTTSNEIITTSDPNKIKVPDFYATFGSDTLFVGFSGLDISDCLGGDLNIPSNTDYGWFFTIRETPAGMRFGLDEFSDPIGTSLLSWDSLQWGNLYNNDLVKFIDITATPPTAIPTDFNAVWKNSAADMATILYRAQFEIAMHAQLMLPNTV